jgi:hypothetical protein
MNCALCSCFHRVPSNCGGCLGTHPDKPATCVDCIIINCHEIDARGGQFCFECDQYPCQRMKNLDKRYRGRYGMSMFENLEIIRRQGLNAFITLEQTRRACPECGALLCVHKAECVYCDANRKDLEGPLKK